MSKNKTNKKPKPPPRRMITHVNATIKVCGRLVSRHYNLICHLPPTLIHETHAAIASTSKELYLITRTPDGKVYIVGGEQWQELDDQT